MAARARRGGQHQAALGHPRMDARLRGRAGEQDALCRIPAYSPPQCTAVYRSLRQSTAYSRQHTWARACTVRSFPYDNATPRLHGEVVPL